VSDKRVIEFGGGALFRKGETTVRSRSLAQFEDDGRAVVTHPQRFLGGLGMGLPPPLAPGEIVARAEWLIGRTPKGRYDFVGSNCEHLANWCVTGTYFESLQARRAFYVSAMVGFLIQIGHRKMNPGVWSRLALIWIATVIGPAIYHRAPYRFWKDILHEWPGCTPPPEGEPRRSA
jgi:hypothetical protein